MDARTRVLVSFAVQDPQPGDSDTTQKRGCRKRGCLALVLAFRPFRALEPHGGCAHAGARFLCRPGSPTWRQRHCAKEAAALVGLSRLVFTALSAAPGSAFRAPRVRHPASPAPASTRPSLSFPLPAATRHTRTRAAHAPRARRRSKRGLWGDWAMLGRWSAAAPLPARAPRARAQGGRRRTALATSPQRSPPRRAGGCGGRHARHACTHARRRLLKGLPAGAPAGALLSHVRRGGAPARACRASRGHARRPMDRLDAPFGRCPALRPQRPLRTLSVGARALPAPPPSMSRGAARSRGAAGPRPRGGRASRALPRGASQAKNLSLGLAPGRGRWRWEAAKSAQGRRSVCVAYSLCVATAL